MRRRDTLRACLRIKILGMGFRRIGTDEAECNGRRVAGPIRSLVNARSLHLECARVLNESLLVPVLTYGNETMKWGKEEMFRVSVVQMNNLRGLLSIRRMNKVPNAWIRQLCGVTKVVDKKIDKVVLRWFGHVERMGERQDC